MPFFGHVDLFSEYRRVFYALENELYLHNSYRFIVFYVELVFSAISTLFIDVTPNLFHLEDPSQSTASLTDYTYFLNDPNIYRHLFFFKLPYLLFDIATALVVWRYVDDVNLKRIALLLWLFNPLTLFATYIFGRFEVISLFFLALTALQLKQHKLILAGICYAAALHCREINLLFAPFFLIAILDFKDHWFKNCARVVFIAAIIALIKQTPDAVLSWFGGDTSLFVPPSGSHEAGALNKLLSLGYYWFYPIVICLSLLLAYTWESHSKTHSERFVIASALALFIYFAFNVHSIHYAAWLVLMPILAIQHSRRVTLPFVALFGIWLILWLLKTDGGVFTPFLAAPLSTDLIGTGHFPTYFQMNFASEKFSLHQVIQIVRSLFFSVLVFFSYRLLKPKHA